MRFEYVVTDKEKGEIRIPISNKELSALYALSFMIRGTRSLRRLFARNNMEKEIEKIIKAWLYLSNDIKSDGRLWEYPNGLSTNGKINKPVVAKRKFYYTKKPKWRKL